jgi:two-component system CheB/CheR fusion protein
VEQYAPPSVLVSPDDNIVHFSEHAWRYLHHPGGNPTSEVSKLVLEELRLELRATIGKARADHTLATSLPVQVVLDGQTRSVSLLVQPAMDHDDLGYLLVIFNEHAENATTLDSESSSKALASELTITRGRLQSIVNEYEIGQAQLKAGYDELQSANEELRSTMEELETSREELQSMNEELSTVNEENRSKVEELSRLTADLNNLLTATSIATLFLDRTLHIQRFTPALAQLFNIRAADGGRPLSDLTHRLGDHSLIADAKQVLDTLMPLERELRDESGRWHLTRLFPYRNTEDGIDGVVVTLVDITARLKHRRYLKTKAVEHT